MTSTEGTNSWEDNAKKVTPAFRLQVLKDSTKLADQSIFQGELDRSPFTHDPSKILQEIRTMCQPVSDASDRTDDVLQTLYTLQKIFLNLSNLPPDDEIQSGLRIFKMHLSKVQDDFVYVVIYLDPTEKDLQKSRGWIFPHTIRNNRTHLQMEEYRRTLPVTLFQYLLYLREASDRISSFCVQETLAAFYSYILPPESLSEEIFNAIGTIGDMEKIEEFYSMVWLKPRTADERAADERTADENGRMQDIYNTLLYRLNEFHNHCWKIPQHVCSSIRLQTLLPALHNLTEADEGNVLVARPLSHVRGDSGDSGKRSDAIKPQDRLDQLAKYIQEITLTGPDRENMRTERLLNLVNTYQNIVQKVPVIDETNINEMTNEEFQKKIQEWRAVLSKIAAKSDDIRQLTDNVEELSGEFFPMKDRYLKAAVEKSEMDSIERNIRKNVLNYLKFVACQNKDIFEWCKDSLKKDLGITSSTTLRSSGTHNRMHIFPLYVLEEDTFKADPFVFDYYEPKDVGQKEDAVAKMKEIIRKVYKQEGKTFPLVVFTFVRDSNQSVSAVLHTLNSDTIPSDTIPSDTIPKFFDRISRNFESKVNEIISKTDGIEGVKKSFKSNEVVVIHGIYEPHWDFKIKKSVFSKETEGKINMFANKIIKIVKHNYSPLKTDEDPAITNFNKLKEAAGHLSQTVRTQIYREFVDGNREIHSETSFINESVKSILKDSSDRHGISSDVPRIPWFGSHEEASAACFFEQHPIFHPLD